MRVKTLCFAFDELGWAFDRWTAALAVELDRRGIGVSRFSRATYPPQFSEDFIFVCWWPDVELIAPKINESQKLFCRITDMVTWNQFAPQAWRLRFEKIVPFVSKFVASSIQIAKCLEQLGIGNVICLSDCVDVEKFRPIMKIRSTNLKPRIGWCGNPTALEWMGFQDLKGLETILMLKNDPRVEFKVATDLRPDTMPQWFQSIDIYVCASLSEGTPLPVLEALATGNLIVSTPVGIIPELKSRGVLMFDGSKEDFTFAVDRALACRHSWPVLGAMNREEAVSEWSSSVVGEKLASWIINNSFPTGTLDDNWRQDHD